MQDSNINKFPDFIKRSILGRAFVGFLSEEALLKARVESNEYLKNLIDREADSLVVYSKLFRGLLILNSISLLFIYGISPDLDNYKFISFPASSGVICLLLGVNLFAFCVNNLDIILYSMIRTEIALKKYGTDLPNIATAHLRTGNLWLDLIRPRTIGYCSSKKQSKLFAILSVMLFSFNNLIIIASLISLVKVFLYSINKDEIFSYINMVSAAGLFIGFIGIAIFCCVQFIPCKYIPSKNE